MTVAVENGLSRLKKHLKKCGYKTVNLENTKEKIDAAVFLHMGLTESGLDFSESSFNNKHNGILLICAANKSFEEIELALRKRAGGRILN